MVTATQENLSAVLYGAGDMRMETRSMPALGPDEVLVRIRATGLCGSDLHYFVHGRNGDFALAHPMCLGHESSGEIIQVGSNVGQLPIPIKVGSRVVVEPGKSCNSCSFCLGGRYNLCPMMRFASSAKTTPHLDGTLQRYLVWPARLCHLLPDNVDYKVAALIEPLAVVLQAISRTNLIPGQSVLILGAGAVGLLACAAAKACGASFVGAVDIDADRLAFGKKNGWIDESYCLGKPAPKGTYATRKEEDAASILADRQQANLVLEHFANSSAILAQEAGFDVVYECTGVPSCINLSIFASKTGGKVGLIGMGHPIVTLPLGAAALREVDIIGVFRYANMFPKAIKLLTSGALRTTGGGIQADQVEGSLSANKDSSSARNGANKEMLGGIANLISHQYSLQDAVSAFTTLRNGRSADGRGVVKVFVVDVD